MEIFVSITKCNWFNNYWYAHDVIAKMEKIYSWQMEYNNYDSTEEIATGFSSLENHAETHTISCPQSIPLVSMYPEVSSFGG